MEKKTINLGRVGLVPKGAYSPDVTYGRLHIVTYKNNTYCSKQEGNTGHEPIGEDDWWSVLVDGQAVNDVVSVANQAAEKANTAAEVAEQTNAAIQTAEQERASAELERKTAETQREAQAQSFANAEQARTEAEGQRVVAEQQREATLSKTKADCEAATKKATDAASEATLSKTKADEATANAQAATAEAENVDATITAANVLEVTGRDGVKKSLDLASQADAATIKEELAGKLDKASVVQELGEAEDKVMSQKVVSDKLGNLFTNKLNKTDLPFKDVKENGVYFVDELGNVFMLYSPENGLNVSKISKDMADKVLAFLSLAQEIGTSENLPISQKAVKEAIESVNANVKGEGAYLCNEKGEVFASFVNGKFEAVGLEHINKLEDIKNVAGGSVGQFLQKKEDGSWSGAYITIDSRSNHPMYGKHFFAFGDSHTEAPGFGLWQMLCELTGAIYHTLLRKKASDGTYHFFSATTSITDYSSLIDEEDTGIEVNCDGFNWAQYAHAAYTYAQSKGFNIDYILVENCHFNKWNFYNDDGSVNEKVPIVLLNKTKVYSQIFENATAVMNFVSKDANVAKVVDELGFDSIDSSFDLRYGTASQELVFSFSNGNTLSADCVAKIHFGDDTSKTISTTLSSGMSLTDCVDAINQWAFNEYSTWVNPSKGTQGNTKILLNYSSEVGGDSSTIANFEVTNSANLVMQQPTISVKATSWIHEYGLKDTSGLKKSSSWLRSGGFVNWALPNAMLGAMQYMGKYSPKTKFVFLGIWKNEMKEEYKYADKSVNPYDLMKSSSYKGGQTSKKSIKNIAELFGWQYIDVDKLCGITPFNVTPTFNNYNNVHMKKDGYRVSAECIAKYIK